MGVTAEPAPAMRGAIDNKTTSMTRMRADLLLVFVAIIWGVAFIAQKRGNDTMGPLSFVGARFLLSFLAVAPLALHESRKIGRAPLGGTDIAFAGLIGLCLFAGAGLQQIGLVTTTATNGGFLTALYVIFVPPILFALTGARPRPIVLVASAVSVVGAWLLTQNGQFQRWTSGDALLLVADIAWAAGISLVPIFLARRDRPFFLAFAQYGVVAALGLTAGLALEPLTPQGLSAALPAILYAGLISGGIAYTLQIVAQKYTPPAEAALIMSLECVVAALAGAMLFSERLTGLAVTGCGLILLGVAMVEAGPALRLAGKGSWRRRLR